MNSPEALEDRSRALLRALNCREESWRVQLIVCTFEAVIANEQQNQRERDNPTPDSLARIIYAPERIGP